MPRGKLRAPRDKQRGSWGKQRANLVKQKVTWKVTCDKQGNLGQVG